MKTTGSDALDNFKALEDRIARVVRKAGEAQEEQEALRARLNAARDRVEALESEVRTLQKERKSVRSRVGELIQLLARLEAENRRTAGAKEAEEEEEKDRHVVQA